MGVQEHSCLLASLPEAPEHQDGVVNLQRWAQLDLHHLHNVCLREEQEGFAVDLR